MTCLSQQYFESFGSLDSLLETVPAKYYLSVSTSPQIRGVRKVTIFFEQRHKVRGKQTRKPFSKLVFYKPNGWDGL